MSKSALHTAYASLLARHRLSPNANQEALITRLATLQQSLLPSSSTSTTTASSSSQDGLYIYGKVGSGKSRLADLFAATLPSSISHRRVHFHTFMLDMHARLHQARSAASYAGDPLPQIGEAVYAESRVLCFDEFQVSDVVDAMILKRLFGAFWRSGGVVVATSNRHPDRLYERGLNRALFLPFIAELKTRCQVWELDGSKDYRLSVGDGESDQRETVFFTDIHAFELSLRNATPGRGKPRSKTIEVMMGRQLHVQAYELTPGSEGQHDRTIVTTTFHDLCEQNLGTADYQALCLVAHTIYLTGVRRLAADELDFVRRLITLVDLAYESKTRLVICSSVPLVEVFAIVIANPESTEGEEGNNEETRQNALAGSADGDGSLQLSVRRGGGSSSSMMSTFVGDVEWSATGLMASLASSGVGEADVRFAVRRAISRLIEMEKRSYGVGD